MQAHSFAENPFSQKLRSRLQLHQIDRQGHRLEKDPETLQIPIRRQAGRREIKIAMHPEAAPFGDGAKEPNLAGTPLLQKLSPFGRSQQSFIMGNSLGAGPVAERFPGTQERGEAA